jgi:hypothetical protein
MFVYVYCDAWALIPLLTPPLTLREKVGVILVQGGADRVAVLWQGARAAPQCEG